MSNQRAGDPPGAGPLHGAAPISALPFDGGLVLLDHGRNRLFVHAGDAATLWAAITAGIDPAEVVQTVRRNAGEQAAAAVETLVRSWETEGLLSGSAPPPTEPELPRRSPAAAVEFWRLDFGVTAMGLFLDPRLAEGWRGYFEGLISSRGPTSGTIAVEVSASGRLFVRRGGELWLSTGDDGLARGAVYQACLDLIHGQPQWRALIHGAAVALGGRAIGFPGPSGSGKSTLTAWLVSRGYSYLSDDLLAVLAQSGCVAPWPVPMSLKSGSWPLIESVAPGLATARSVHLRGQDARWLAPPPGAWTEPPSPLAALVFPRYTAGASTRLLPLRPLDTLARLVGDRIWIGHPLDAEAVGGLLDWIATTPAFALTYSSLGGAEAEIARLLNQPV
jgi:hypothetical protein